MTHGPNARPISSAVIAAITARKVRYWNTRRKPSSGDSVCSHWLRLSSMARSAALALQRGDDLFHLHEARALDQHRGATARRLRRAPPAGADVVEVARAGAERRGRVRRKRAGGPQRSMPRSRA